MRGRGEVVLRQEADAFVRRSVFLIDQTFTQVMGNDLLLGYAQLLDRGFDFGHGAHDSP
jgi:hypothetical protein